MNVSTRVQACTEHGRKPLSCFFIYDNFRRYAQSGLIIPIIYKNNKNKINMTIYYLIVAKEFNQLSTIYYVHASESVRDQKQIEKIKNLSNAGGFYFSIRNRESIEFICRMLEHYHGITIMNPRIKLPIGAVQDVTPKVALSICKNMLNPLNVKNLSQNFKNIDI